MAIGFLPSASKVFPLNACSAEHFLVVAVEAAQSLEWKIGPVSADGFVAYTSFSSFSWSEEVSVRINGDQVRLKSACTGNQLIDWGKNRKNLERLTSAVEELLPTYTSEALTQQYEELKHSFAAEDEVHMYHSQASTREKITHIFDVFKPIEGYFITPILIILTTLVFIMMVKTGVDFLAPSSQDLLKWGGNFRIATRGGDWWRLITCCFLHIGIVHLLLNMYALFYIGLLLEPMLGKTRFLTAYLVTGVLASVASLWWHDFSISAGASGAIFGLYGVCLAMLTTRLIEESARKTFLSSILLFVGYNLVNGLQGEVDNAAHVGGLLSGLVVGYAYFPSLYHPWKRTLKDKTIILIVASALVISTVVYQKLPNDMPAYDMGMQKFSSMEEMALAFYNMPEDTPASDLLYELKDRGIYYWQQNLLLLKELDSLDLPQPIEQRHTMLKQYCELRIKTYELIYKGIEQSTEMFQVQIQQYDKEINDLVTQMNVKIE